MCDPGQWSIGTNLNELMDDLADLHGKLCQADPLGRRTPIVCSQLKF